MKLFYWIFSRRIVLAESANKLERERERERGGLVYFFPSMSTITFLCITFPKSWVVPFLERRSSFSRHLALILWQQKSLSGAKHSIGMLHYSLRASNLSEVQRTHEWSLLAWKAGSHLPPNSYNKSATAVCLYFFAFGSSYYFSRFQQFPCRFRINSFLAGIRHFFNRHLFFVKHRLRILARFSSFSKIRPVNFHHFLLLSSLVVVGL